MTPLSPEAVDAVFAERAQQLASLEGRITPALYRALDAKVAYEREALRAATARVARARAAARAALELPAQFFVRKRLTIPPL